MRTFGVRFAVGAAVPCVVLETTAMTKHDNDTGIRVLADTREVRSGIPHLLETSQGLAVRVRQLTVGDYLIDGRVVVERKRLDDLAFSIMDTRLFTQFARILRTGRRAILLLEGTTAHLRRQRISRTSLQGALLTLSIAMGIPIVRSTGPDESARLLRLIADRCVPRPRPIRPVAPHTPAEACGLSPPARLLCAVPGIGPSRAVRLIERFGSIRGLLDAQPQELLMVPGVGAGTVARLLEALTGSKRPGEGREEEG